MTHGGLDAVDDAGLPAHHRDDLPPRARGLRRQRGRHVRGRRRAAARSFARGGRPGRPARRARCAASGSSRATGSAPSCGTTRSTSRRTSRFPCMGAVLHTLNIRLFPEQLAYIVNHAEDRVVIVDDTLVPAAGASSRRELPSGRALRRRRRRRRRPRSRATAPQVLRYDELLAAEQPGYRVPRDRRARRRGDVLHERHHRQPEGCRLLAPLDVPALDRRRCSGARSRFTERDRVLPDRPDVPRQRVGHARTPRGWPAPTSSCRTASSRPSRWRGSSARRRPRARARCRRSGPTSSATPSRTTRRPLVAASGCMCGGSAVPRSLMERFEERFGVRIVQGWGMTETSPLAAMSLAAEGRRARHDRGDRLARARPGASSPGVELRIVDDDGAVLPWDGEAVGEIQVRGPWITGSYYRDPDRARSSTTAGCAPATSPASPATASSRSPTAPRTSSSRAASGSRRSSSKST